MSKYQIIRSIEDDNKAVILNDTEGRFFKGYDFMGSVDWTDRIADATWMGIDEAHQTVKDLKSADEPAEPEADPMMEKLQTALDGAVLDRDDFYKQYEMLIKEGKPSDMIHRMYLRYEHAQGYVEGLTNAIFIAGYGIQSAVDSSKLTLTK